MFKGHHATGTIVGTAGILNVLCGFIPQQVRLMNETGLVKAEWVNTMDADSAIKTVTAGTISKITIGGISPYEGTRGGDQPGFSIGTDADINVSGEVLHWEAFSSDA